MRKTGETFMVHLLEKPDLYAIAARDLPAIVGEGGRCDRRRARSKQ